MVGHVIKATGLNWTPSPGRGKNLVPNIPVTCVLTKCLLLEIESLVGFPLVSWWAWEQIQYQESDYEIIIHCSLLGRKFRAVSLHGATVEEGSQEKRLRGSLHVVSPCAPCLGGRGKATETSPLVQGWAIMAEALISKSYHWL